MDETELRRRLDRIERKVDIIGLAVSATAAFGLALYMALFGVTFFGVFWFLRRALNT